MKKKPAYLTKSILISEYGFTKDLIEKHLPKPKLVKNPHYASGPRMKLWEKSEVERIIASSASLRKKLGKKNTRKLVEITKEKNAEEYLKSFSPEDLFEAGRQLSRKFVLHVGPTNSGKTYDAISNLKQAVSGTYLGPLRLLALEMYETLNSDGFPCSLLTGEEYIEVKNAGLTASTVELCDYSKHYEVAVIDEAQMIADPFRGHHWLEAICLVNADIVNICLAPEALPLIEKILARLGVEYETSKHERLVPLKFSGTFRDITAVEPGDAVITFSRKNVLQLSAVLDKKQIKSSVIYGALPPASRREEVRRFAEKETSVVVATDAIGMGISLPIKRIIFFETEKFDGEDRRELNISEIKQIAGRAGRYGKYDLGEVLTTHNSKLIKEALEREPKEIHKLVLGFPESALAYDYPLDRMLKIWDSLSDDELFKRSDMRDAEFLLAYLGSEARNADRTLLYNLITCPVDVKNESLVKYWRICCTAIIRREKVPKPQFSTADLNGCEMQYKAFDIYHQLLRRIGIESDCLTEKEKIAEKINSLLKKEKSSFLSRCRLCGKELPIQYRYNICQKCYEREAYR